MPNDRAAEDHVRVVGWDAAGLSVAQKADGLTEQTWLWVTCPDPRFRDGRRALAAATLACTLTDRQVARALHALASAQAEVGDVAAALATLDEVDRLPANPERAVTVRIDGNKLRFVLALPRKDDGRAAAFTARARTAFVCREGYRDPR